MSKEYFDLNLGCTGGKFVELFHQLRSVSAFQSITGGGAAILSLSEFKRCPMRVSHARLWLLVLLVLVCTIYGGRKAGRRVKKDVDSAPNFVGGRIEVNGKCPSDPELETLVRSKNTRTIMYIITFNNASDYIAQQYMSCRKDWVRVARVPINEYYESSIFETFLNSRKSEWRSYDYVLTATYKTLTPMLLHPSMPPQTFDHIKEMLQLARNDLYDVYPFIRAQETLLNASVSYHTSAFQGAWEGFLRELYLDDETIGKCNGIQAFYRNMFLIKSTYLAKVVNAMNRAFKVARKENIRKLLSQDAHYKLGSTDIAQQVFGTPYYQLHPFIFQLLPPCFLSILNARVCMAPVGPCAFNYKYEG